MKICENGGCMLKLPGNQLVALLDAAGVQAKGFEDSAIFRAEQDEMLISTDFGFLVGDNCEDAGKIAVLNAISDIYAMGGEPLYANIILVLGNDINEKEKRELLSSVVKTCREENVEVIGGHTLMGEKTIIGLTVVGKKENNLFYKKNCKKADVLLLNKPIGTGAALQARYNGLLKDDSYVETMKIMKQSNRLNVKSYMRKYFHAMTDITGYGLLGHLSEMLDKTQGATLYLNKIPYIKELGNLSVNVLENEVIRQNVDYVREQHDIRWHLDTVTKLLLFDPQTNGPLLISADKEILPYIKENGLVNIGIITDNNEICVCEG